MPKTKVENGRTYELINSRWHLKDATEDDVEVRNGPKGKEYRVKGTDKWQAIDDTSQGEVADQKKVDAKADLISRVDRPKNDKEAPALPRSWGEKMLQSPWKYGSPLDYIKAYAVKPPKTKAGRLLFDTINTASWLTTWYSNRQGQKPTPESKAIDEGYEIAMRNFDEWTGHLDPEKGLEEVSSRDLAKIYARLNKTVKDMEPYYKQAVGKTDPDSLRLKTQYKTYLKMKQSMDKAVADAKDRKKNPKGRATFGDADMEALRRRIQQANEQK